MYKYVLVLFALLCSSCTHIEIDVPTHKTTKECTIYATEQFFLKVPLKDCGEKDNWVTQQNTLFHIQDIQKPLLSFFYKQGTESNEDVLKRLFIKENNTCSIRILSSTDHNTRLQITSSGSTLSTCGTFTTMGSEESYFEFQEGKMHFFFKHPTTHPLILLQQIHIEK